MDDYSQMSREELIMLVQQYENLSNKLIERMMDSQTQDFASEEEKELTAFETRMLKILNFYIRYSASTSRSRVWGKIFSDFGFKQSLQFARWGSRKATPIEVKGAKEIVAVFSGKDSEILREAGMSPKSFFASIRWKE